MKFRKMIKHGLRTTLLLTIGATIISCNLYGRKSGKGNVLYLDGAPNTEAKAKTTLSYEADTASADYEIPALRKNSGEIILHRKGYTVSYNPTTKIPNWVAWHLTADHTSGQAKRKGVEFHEDTDVPEPRANTFDYMQSGYDRGHMCPAGDNKWDMEAMEQSFLFSNICPQNHNLNTGDWNGMEQQCRWWAKDFGDIYIVCGPILFNQKHKTIGKNKVVVPEAFFKVVLCMKGTPKAIGFIYRNAEGGRPWGDYVNTVDQVERITGYDFFPALPDSIENKIEAHADLSEWPK